MFCSTKTQSGFVEGGVIEDIVVDGDLDVSDGNLILADNAISGNKIEGGIIDNVTINNLIGSNWSNEKGSNSNTSPGEGNSNIKFFDSTYLKWGIGLRGTAKDLQIDRYNDGGNYVDTVLQINKSNGIINIGTLKCTQIDSTTITTNTSGDKLSLSGTTIEAIGSTNIDININSKGEGFVNIPRLNTSSFYEEGYFYLGLNGVTFVPDVSYGRYVKINNLCMCNFVFSGAILPYQFLDGTPIIFSNLPFACGAVSNPSQTAGAYGSAMAYGTLLSCVGSSIITCNGKDGNGATIPPTCFYLKTHYTSTVPIVEIDVNNETNINYAILPLALDFNIRGTITIIVGH